jgi:hypothetical protein
MLLRNKTSYNGRSSRPASFDARALLATAARISAARSGTRPSASGCATLNKRPSVYGVPAIPEAICEVIEKQRDNIGNALCVWSNGSASPWQPGKGRLPQWPALPGRRRRRLADAGPLARSARPRHYRASPNRGRGTRPIANAAYRAGTSPQSLVSHGSGQRDVRQLQVPRRGSLNPP